MQFRLNIISFRLILVLILIFFSALVSAKERWIGLYVSDNSGISYKDWQNRWNAYDYGIGWSLDKEAAITAKVDYLTHDYDLVEVPEGKLPIYYGIGAGIEFGSELSAGFRIPVGVNYLFKKIPYDVFVEIVPMLRIYPSTVVAISGAIGVRYHFNDK